MSAKPRRDWAKEEKLFLRLLEQGHSQAAIARHMECSPSTLSRQYGELISAHKVGKLGEIYTQEQRGMVQAMTGFGLNHEEIAAVMGMSESALETHFAEELRTGLPLAVAQMASSLFKSGRAGDVSAQKFYLGCQGGWTTQVAVKGSVDHKHEHTVTEPETADALRTLDLSGRAALRVALGQLGAESALEQEGPSEEDTVH